MTTDATINIFAESPTPARVAAIERRLRVLEHNPLFGQQRLSQRLTSGPPLPSSYTRLGLAPVVVNLPEDTSRLRFSVVAGLYSAGLQTGGVVFSLYNVYEPLDTIYNPGVLESFGHAVEDFSGGQTRPIFGTGVVEYKPNVVGQQTYALDAYYFSGTPVVDIEPVAISVEIV